MGSRPLRIKFDKIDGFIKIYDGIRYLELFGYWKCDEIFGNIKYGISEESGITKFCRNRDWFIQFFTYIKYINVS